MIADDLKRANAAERARKRYAADPTNKEKAVLHAVAVWQQGCSLAPGECKECNDLFFKELRKRLRSSRRQT